MTLERKLEILRYLRNNNVEPTEVNLGLMELLGFVYGDCEGNESESWYISSDE